MVTSRLQTVITQEKKLMQEKTKKRYYTIYTTTDITFDLLCKLSLLTIVGSEVNFSGRFQQADVCGWRYIVIGHEKPCN